MLIALILYAALCLLLLGIAVKLVMVAFRPSAATDGNGQSPDVTSESPTQPLEGLKMPRQRRTSDKNSTSVSSSRDDLVEKLERQFHNSPSLSSNPEE